MDILRNLIDVIYDQPPALIELYIWMEVVSFLIDHKFNDASQEEDCAKVVHKLMGLAVSYTIADKNFLEQTKPRVEQMVSNIREEFDQMVLETDWMDAYTKYASLEKSKAMKPLIGFPEWILDVKKLERHYQGVGVDYLNQDSTVYVYSTVQYSYRSVQLIICRTGSTPSKR